MKNKSLVLSMLIVLMAFGFTNVRAQEGLIMAGVEDPAQRSSAAAIQRISTLTVFPYDPFDISVSHIEEKYTGNLPNPFIFDVSSFGSAYVSNLTYLPIGGATCQEDQLVITCTGVMTSIEINFDFTYITTDYAGPYIWWGYRGYSDIDLEYTFNLIYPAPLIYVKPYSQAPISVTADQVTWYQENTRSLVGAALFYDPRVQSLYLPLMRLNH